MLNVFDIRNMLLSIIILRYLCLFVVKQILSFFVKVNLIFMLFVGSLVDLKYGKKFEDNYL